MLMAMSWLYGCTILGSRGGHGPRLLRVQGFGGTPPYSFDWGSEDPNALSEGTFEVTITDANLCIARCDIVINEPPLLTCSASVIQDVQCFGGNTGQASVQGFGGTLPYSYD